MCKWFFCVAAVMYNVTSSVCIQILRMCMIYNGGRKWWHNSSEAFHDLNSQVMHMQKSPTQFLELTNRKDRGIA